MYFFINTDVGHTAQSQSQCFRAISTNEFNCTSKLTLTGSGDKKAFAAQTGVLIVQEDGSGRVNVALRPLNNLGVGKPPVSMYVYRGLSKSNFISSSTGKIIPSGDAKETEFTASVWSAYSAYHSGSTTGPIEPTAIGFDAALAGTTTLESIFNGAHTAQAHVVSEGMYIGDWDNTSDIGFEVVLLSNDFEPTLDFLRASDHVINVSSISNATEKKMKREECLAFLDPAALYGLHYYDEVTGEDASEVQTTYDNLNGPFSTLLDFFYSKNRVYVDVRNEYGYSYNLYDNYKDASGKHIKFGHSEATPSVTTDQVYGISDWPIHYTDNGPLNASMGDVKLALRLAENSTADNTVPLLFYSQYLGSTAQDEDKWIIVDDTTLTDSGNNTDWTTLLTLEYPNYGTAGSKTNVAWFFRLHYVRQAPYAGSNLKVPKAESLSAQCFGPINPDIIFSTTNGFGQWSSPIPRLVYGEMLGTSAPFSFIGYLSAYWDDQNVLFTFSPETTFVRSGEEVMPTAYGEKYRIDLKSYDVSQRKSMPWFGLQELDVNDGGTTVSVKLLDLEAYETTVPTKEKVQLLGLSKTEFDTIKARTGLEDHHGKFLKLTNITSVNTDPDVSVGEVQISGLDSSGNYATASAGTAVKIYF